MTDERRSDDLLREDAAALPPPAAGEINPWSMAMTRVLWGLGLITITLNFLYLDVILPAVGGLLLVLAANLIYIALAPQKEKATV